MITPGLTPRTRHAATWTAAALAALLFLPPAAQARDRDRDRSGWGWGPHRDPHRGHGYRDDDSDGSHDHELDRGEYRPRKGFKLRGYRTIDGSRNNRRDPGMNAIGGQLLRLLESDYGDGKDDMAGGDRPSPRAISNSVAAQSTDLPNPFGTSDYLWQWGQFVDHDIDLTPGVTPAEPVPIEVPVGDVWFDPLGLGGMIIPFNRSIYDPGSTPRQQVNLITGWIDASNVYGSDEFRAMALRELDGSGRLKTSAGNLLPFNVDGLPNANDVGLPDEALFLAGDERANEQAALAAMHTLFVREHNRIADWMRAHGPWWWSGDRIYEIARKIVGAQMQVITYEEFLPALLGEDAIRPYRGYSRTTDARIANVFSTAAYRFGHSALSPTLLRVEADGSESPFGHLPLRAAFFSPARITDEGGIEPLLRGLAAQLHQNIDHLIVDDVRNFLFGPPGSGGFDLASLNLQRGRDHGLPSYNDAREKVGLPRAESFADISSDPEVVARLADAYDTPDDVDLWIGGLCEDPHGDAQVGELFKAIIADQFEALRDGDRFYYERTFLPYQVRKLKRVRLSDIIHRHKEIADELPDDVFRVPEL